MIWGTSDVVVMIGARWGESVSVVLVDSIECRDFWTSSGMISGIVITFSQFLELREMKEAEEEEETSLEVEWNAFG